LIDFRYHIVSLIAVFLALALGLFLGSTTLQSTVTNNLKNQADHVTSENKRLTAEKAQLATQLDDERGLVAGVQSYAVGGRLPGESVAVVSAPGVNGDDRKAVEDSLKAAGATITADVQLQSAYLDPTQDGVLGGLATQLALPGHSLPQGNGSTEASAELAAVLATRPGHKAVGRVHVESTLSALSDGKFITVSGNPPTHAATLTVMLVPPPSTSLSAQTAQIQNTILLALARQLREVSTGVVLAGQTPTPTVAGGALAAARSDSTLSKSVSTVDLSSDIDPIAGPIAVVLALADSATGTVGAYGLGQKPPVPTPSASP
jgi:Copper transport outer membrane protein, MctB